MLNRVSRAAVLVAALATGAPVWAETPMTPLRPIAPPGPPPDASSSAAKQWVDPPAAPTPKMPSQPATENAAPGVQPEQSAPPTRTSRQERRLARGRSWSTRQLNYRQFYGGWSGASMPNSRGYGPAPYSNSGN
jgi:type IV secretory pathway VirB10-like protein